MFYCNKKNIFFCKFYTHYYAPNYARSLCFFLLGLCSDRTIMLGAEKNIEIMLGLCSDYARIMLGLCSDYALLPAIILYTAYIRIYL